MPAWPVWRSEERSLSSARPVGRSRTSTRSDSAPPGCSLTRPPLVDYTRTPDEFSWRAGEVLDAIAAGTVRVTVSNRYPLADAAQAHRDLQGRKTVDRSSWCLSQLPGDANRLAAPITRP